MYKIEQYDVFNSFLVSNAEYAGNEELPIIKTSKLLPNKVILFSECLKINDYDQWVLFYEHDYKFMRLWRKPKTYLKILKKFKGIIMCDYSMYRNMPLVMQKWSCYMNRALANYFIENGIEVIPNIRWSDERSYDFIFDGIEKYSTIAIGSLGGNDTLENKYYFINGFKKTIDVLKPKNIIIYGSVPNEILNDYPNINFMIFKSTTYNYLES